jgi:hypothetical protein
MSGQMELPLGGVIEASDMKGVEHFLQRQAVQPVQGGPGERAVTHVVHEGTILGAPGVGKGRPVGLYPIYPATLLAVLDAAAAPVDHGAEHITNQGLHVSEVHLHAPLFPRAKLGTVYG